MHQRQRLFKVYQYETLYVRLDVRAHQRTLDLKLNTLGVRYDRNHSN